MKAEEIRQLLEKYYQGETTLEEEKKLREILMNTDDPELDDDKRLFAMMDAGRSETSSMDHFAPVKMKPERGKASAGEDRFRLTRTTGIAAALGLLILGFSGGLLINGQFGNSKQIAAIQEDLKKVKALTTMHRLGNESASDRILAAYEIGQQPSADEETLNTLVTTLLTDDHVNVRIAAADALFKFGDHEKVRKAFIEALTTEEDPNLQIRLIDMLIGMKEKRALPELQKVMENEDKLTIVRERAAQGLAQLL